MPKINSKVIPASPIEPLIVSLDKKGLIYLDIDKNVNQPIEIETLVNRVVAVLRYQPATKIFLKADAMVSYGRVVEIMASLQIAGVDDIGMITAPDTDSN